MVGGWTENTWVGCGEKGLQHEWGQWGINFGMHPSNETRHCNICHAAQSRGQTELTRKWWGEE